MNSITKVYAWDSNSQLLIGRLSVSAGITQFQYAKSYLAFKDAHPLNPIHLPLLSGDFSSEKGLAGPLAVFGDCLPGAWGRAVIEAENGGRASDLEALLSNQSDRVGNLAFSLDPHSYPDIGQSYSHFPLEWGALLDAINKFERTRVMSDTYRDIIKHGSTQGGARPKLSMIRDGELYIIKLPSARDINNVCQIEHGTMRLAHALGLNVATSELLSISPGRDLFITKRFDVDPVTGGKSPYLSMRSILGADHPAEASYPALAEQLKRLNGGLDSTELFDRMIFNLAVSNHDDHDLNHAVCFNDNTWRLTPAFDIVAGEGGKTHAITLGSEGRKPSIENAISFSSSFGLTRNEALDRALNMVTFIENNWKEVFKGAGVSEDVIQTISWAMLHDVTAKSILDLQDQSSPGHRL